MFTIGDRVRKRYADTEKKLCDNDSCEVDHNYNPEGVVVTVVGRWITVKHDPGGPLNTLVGPRYDYQADELVHLNPLLRLVEEF